MKKITLHLILALILFIGIALRMLGISWGLSAAMLPHEPTFHPDEVPAYIQSVSLYRQPDALTFTWGGAFYYRIAYLIRNATTSSKFSIAQDLRNTIYSLRILNIIFAVLSALFIFRTASLIYGSTAGILSVAFFLFFPSHTLASHYARGDILLTLLCAISLYFSINFSINGKLKFAFIAAVFSGLAVSTMSWGLFTFVPILFGWLEFHRFKITKGHVASLISVGLLLLLGGIVGYTIGSFESFYYWDVFISGCQRASQMHKSHFVLPLSKAGTCAFYGFGCFGVFLGYMGVLVLWKQRALKGNLTLISYFISGLILLGFQKNDMMRYVLFLSPFMAISASASLVFLSEKWSRPKAYAATSIALLFTLQLSAGYVIPMHFSKDIRYQAGEWILSQIHSHTKATVGVTHSYYYDWTYQPRFPPNTRIILHPLMLRHNFDSSGYINKHLDFIVTSDFAQIYASGKTAQQFMKELRSESKYKLIKTFKPPWYPISLPNLLNLKKTGDLLYIRLSFFVYQLRS